MLKHLSNRSDGANSQLDSFSDLEKSVRTSTATSLESSVIYEDTSYPSYQGIDNYSFDNSFDNDQVGDGLRIRLSKPTIRRILERDKLRRGSNYSGEIFNERDEISNETHKKTNIELYKVESSSMTPPDEFSVFCSDLNDNTRTSEKNPVSFSDEHWKRENVMFHPQYDNATCLKDSNDYGRKECNFQEEYSRPSSTSMSNHFPSKFYELSRSNEYDLSSSKYTNPLPVDARFNSEFLEPGINHNMGSLTYPKHTVSMPTKTFSDVSTSIPDSKNELVIRNEHASHNISEIIADKYAPVPAPRNCNYDACENNDDFRLQKDTGQHSCNDIDQYQKILKRGKRLCKYIGIFFVIVIAVACILAGILHFYVGYYPDVVHMNEGDVKLLPISPLFCQSIKGLSKSNKLRLLAFKQKSKPTLYENTMTETMNIYPTGTWKREFYLLKGSSIKVKIKSVFSLDILSFVGEKNYLIWSSRQKSKTYSSKIICCSGTKEKEKNIVINALEDDRYFIVMHNKVEIVPVEVSVEMTFVRIIYDFTDTTSSCLANKGSKCVLHTSFDSKVSCAAEVPFSNDANKISESSAIEWECVPRTWFFILIYFLVFLCVSGMIVAAYYITVMYCMTTGRWCFPKYDLDKDRTMRLQYDKNQGNKAMEADNHFDSKYISKAKLEGRTTKMANERSQRNSNGKHIYNSHSSISLENRKIPIRPNSNESLVPYIEAIYPRTRFCSDTADSGISIDEEYMKETNKHELLQLQELQMQNLNNRSTRHSQQLEITDGPRVNQLLQRPKSTVSSENINYCYGSHDSLHNYRPNQNHDSTESIANSMRRNEILM